MTLPEAIALVTKLALDGLLRTGRLATTEEAQALAQLENYGIMVEDKAGRYSHGKRAN